MKIIIETIASIMNRGKQINGILIVKHYEYLGLKLDFINKNSILILK